MEIMRPFGIDVCSWLDGRLLLTRFGGRGIAALGAGALENQLSVTRIESNPLYKMCNVPL